MQRATCGSMMWRILFQSSPVPEDGCNRTQFVHDPTSSSFNPHPSRRTGATAPSRSTGATVFVSILTRPGGRVQRCRCCARATGTTRFQSSPVPEDGCNCRTWSSPSAVNLVSILSRPGGRVQRGCARSSGSAFGFQSSPVPEDGCNWRRRGVNQRDRPFQSSPVPEDGCNVEAIGSKYHSRQVSILTRPGGRVQRNPHPSDSGAASSFNPHPSRRTGATSSSDSKWNSDCSFNPHPSRRTGATFPR